MLSGYRIDESKLRTVARTVLARLGLEEFELSVQLVGSAGIRRLNKIHRGLDKATDVLSFPQEEFAAPVKVRAAKKAARRAASAPPRVLGDVVISLPDAEKNARSIGQDLDREVAFLLVHGILHLGGHDHMKKAEERRMLKEQRALMTALAGSKRPLWQASVTRRAARKRRA